MWLHSGSIRSGQAHLTANPTLCQTGSGATERLDSHPIPRNHEWTQRGEAASTLECADLSALSAGDLSPSNAGRRPTLPGRWTRPCFGDKSQSGKSGDKSPHSKFLPTCARSFITVAGIHTNHAGQIEQIEWSGGANMIRPMASSVSALSGIVANGHQAIHF